MVERNISLALVYLEQMPEDLDFDGQPRECRAHTRKGTPCQRQPLPGRDYCPSHKHLEETFEPATITEELAEPGVDRGLGVDRAGLAARGEGTGRQPARTGRRREGPVR